MTSLPTFILQNRIMQLLVSNIFYFVVYVRGDYVVEQAVATAIKINKECQLKSTCCCIHHIIVTLRVHRVGFDYYTK